MGKHDLISLVLLLVVSFSPAWSSDDQAVVRDIDGNPLEVGSEYVIQAVENGWYGPPIVSSGRFHSSIPCPQYPIISPTTDAVGQPLKFIPVDQTEETSEIQLSSPIQIDSGFSAYCRSDGLWKVTLDALNRRQVIVGAGAFGLPPATFKIELAPVGGPLRFAYKLSLVDEQQDVTAFPDIVTKVKLLGLTDENSPSEQPLYVLFVKYHKNEVRNGAVALQ